MTQSVRIYDFAVRSPRGEEATLAAYAGKVLLIVNTASNCGFTPQYDGLEDLFKKYQGRGLMVLGFPCNQFGHQEPGTDTEIQSFCEMRKVSFPVFSKIDVNGAAAHPLFRFLKSERKGFLGSQAIKWNFTKFLVNQTGEVVKRYAPTVAPADIEKDVAALLGDG